MQFCDSELVKQGNTKKCCFSVRVDEFCQKKLACFASTFNKETPPYVWSVIARLHFFIILAAADAAATLLALPFPENGVAFRILMSEGII